MIDGNDSLLSPDDISERFHVLQQEGFPPDGVEALARELAYFCRGTGAEAVLANLIRLLPPGTVSSLVSTEVMPRADSDPKMDFCGSHRALLIRELINRQFQVESGGDWLVKLPDQTELAPLVSPVTGEATGTRLCRLALLGVWVLRMRTAPRRTPSY